ncbi:hypothetical protein MKX08_002220 [Trichoderma sp. CBMAI-0020]|nr:hypothetical protein MKX08_002220 [Trichoderma sp. CBMAI-0020]
MQQQYFELDPHGDVLLILRRPNQHEIDLNAPRLGDTTAIPEPDNDADVGEPNDGEEDEQVQFLLSSRHLSLASPVFSTMLSGGWKESTVLDELPKEIARSENRNGSNSEAQPRHEISASEWNTAAFLLLMNIIHGHHRQVPQQVDLETLAHFSILVDYYKCHEITEFFAHFWMEKLTSCLPRDHCPSSTIWIFVSWVFSNASIFEKMTELALKESQGPLETLFLPLPLAILDAIEEKRTSSLQEIMHDVDELRKGLINGSRGCGSACSSMLLGALIRESDLLMLDQNVQRSIKQIKSDVTGVETPTWYTRGDYHPRRHSCSIRGELEPAVDGVLANLKGLKLDDYRVQNEDEVPKA